MQQQLLSDIEKPKDSRLPEPSFSDKIKLFCEEHKTQLILGGIGIILFYVLIIRTGVLSKAFHGLKEYLDRSYDTHPFLVFISLFLLVVFVTCFMIFSHAAICMLTATILDSFWLSLFLLISASMAGSALIFLLSKPLCANFILSKIEKSDYYIVLKNESKKNPWITAFATRMLFIPAGSKDYILTMIDNPMVPYFVSCFCIHMFYIIESCLIAQQINEFGDDHKKPWSEKSPTEKFFSIMIILIIVFTVFLIVFIGKYVTKKIEEKKSKNEGTEMKVLSDSGNAD